MTLRHTLLFAGTTALLFFSSIVGVQAEQAFGNRSVTGVCMISRNAVLSNSKVGENAEKQLKKMAQDIDQKLASKQKPLDASLKELKKKSDSLSDKQLQSQQRILNQRLRAFNQHAKEMNARLQLTRHQITQRIAKTLDPLIVKVYKDHKCGILLQREAVIGGNYSNDLTGAALEALNKKVTHIKFDLAELPKSKKSK